MSTVDLASAAKELARLATAPSKEAGDKSMRRAAKAVLAAVAGAKPAAVRAAVRSLATGAAKAHGPHADVLHLTLGALVEEAGAPAETAWPVLARQLPEAFAQATAFGVAVVRAAKTQVVADAMAAKGAELAASMPEEARAWQELPARCLAAAACLSRSRALRDEARAAGLRKGADTLALGVAEVAQVVQLLDALEDEKVLVLHPEAKRGFEARASEITMVAELLVMIADALCGDPKKGKLEGARPTAGAVKALQNENPRKRGKPVRVPASFELLPLDALDAHGHVDGRAHAHDHGLDLSASPASLTRVAGHVVVLLRDPDHLHAMELEPPPGSLSPRVQITRELEAREVESWLTRLAKRALPSPKKKAAPKTSPKKKAAPKTTTKKKAAPKTATKKR
jgi:hypothetical protein